VFESKIVEDSSNAPCGTVLCVKKKIIIKALDNAIELTRVLMPGKKIISGSEFANGQKLFNLGDIVK
jgi:methionyl-tRNA formyltransferase